MEYFGADDLEAFSEHWSWGGRKPRAQSTLDGYLGEIRRYLAWADETGATTTTVRAVQRYVAHRRRSSEHAAELAVRALSRPRPILGTVDPACCNTFDHLLD